MNYFHKIEVFTMDRWLRCQAGDLTATRINEELIDETADILAWELLNDDYLLTFGMNRKHAHFMQLQKKLTLLQLDYVITDDMFLFNEIQEITEEINNLFKDENKGENNITKTLIYLSKWVGFKLKLTEVTVLEFFTMLNEYSKDQKNG